MSLRRSRGAPVERSSGPVKPQFDRVGRGDHAHVAHPVDEDAVAVHEAVHAARERVHLGQDLLEALQPARGQVVREAADAAVAVGDAGARQVGEVLVDVVADRDQVQERRHRAEFHQCGGDTGQVVGDPRILGEQRAQVTRPRRDVDPHQLLDGLAVREVVDQRRAVIQPVDVGNQVVPGVRLALLLEAPVQVAAVHIGAHDPLARKFGHDLDRAMRGRVRGADVDDDRAFGRARLEGRPDRVGQCRDRGRAHGFTSR